MYKCILLPTDGTEFCERAFRHGIELAKLVQAKVVGLTVTLPIHSAVPRSLIPGISPGSFIARLSKPPTRSSPSFRSWRPKPASPSKLCGRAMIILGRRSWMRQRTSSAT